MDIRVECNIPLVIVPIVGMNATIMPMCCKIVSSRLSNEALPSSLLDPR
jgi:hypothetical protein